MASFSSIRDGIKTRLATISSLITYDTVPDDVITPAAIVGVPESVRYDFAMRSAVAVFRIPVRVLTGRVVEDAAQDVLDGYLAADGAGSIRAAIDADATLGAVAQTTRVQEVRGYGVYEVAGVPYLGAEWVLEVIA